MSRCRPVVTTLTLACATVLIATTSRAQDDEPKPPAPATPAAPSVTDERPTTPEAPKTYPPYRRVPSNFGKVGLSTQQREDIYIIRGRYRSEIAALKARIDELSRKEMDECESVLTEAQRKLLDQIRAVSRPVLLGSGSNSNN